MIEEKRKRLDRVVPDKTRTVRAMREADENPRENYSSERLVDSSWRIMQKLEVV